MVLARQHSSAFYQLDKVAASQTSNLCPYSESLTYMGGAGMNGSGNWLTSPSHSYSSVNPYLAEDHQRRWIAQQERNLCRRERRADCRGLHHSTGQVDQQMPLQSNFSTTPFLESAHLPRSSAFHAPHPRSSVGTQNPSSWNSWETEQSSSLNSQRFSNLPSSWNNQLHDQIPQFNASPFGDMIFTPSDASSAPLFSPAIDQPNTLDNFTFPHRFSPDLSPSPSPVHHLLPSVPGSLYHSRRSSEDRSDGGKSCSHCHATSTPLWRRDPSTMKPLCNACGLYLQQRNKLRPQELIDADDDGSTSDESDANYVGPECSHCRTHHTSVWRRSKTGDQLCNACGVYARLRGKPRPLSLKRKKIRPRSKHSPKQNSFS